MFTSLQQKEISGCLTYLWQTDPFKAKWSILAKAYSLIRDSIGKEKAPLDSYLAINGPFIGIVPPEQYLEMLGWKIVAGEDGGKLLRRDFDVDFDSLNQDLLTSNVSVNDIIEYTYATGYIAADEGNLIVPDNEPAMTMATSVQYNLPMKSANFVPVHKTTFGASGPTTAVTMVDANNASEQNLSRPLRAEAEKDGTESGSQGKEPKEKSSDEKNENATSLPDREVTEDTSSPTDVGTDTVASMDPSSIALNETGLNGSEVTANTQTALASQDNLPNSHVAWTAEQVAVLDNPLPGSVITELAQLAVPVILPSPNPVDYLNNDPSMFFDEDDCYPYNNHFAPEKVAFKFDPYMGSAFNAFDIDDFRRFITDPDSV